VVAYSACCCMCFYVVACSCRGCVHTYVVLSNRSVVGMLLYIVASHCVCVYRCVWFHMVSVVRIYLFEAVFI